MATQSRFYSRLVGTVSAVLFVVCLSIGAMFVGGLPAHGAADMLRKDPSLPITAEPVQAEEVTGELVPFSTFWSQQGDSTQQDDYVIEWITFAVPASEDTYVDRDISNFNFGSSQELLLKTDNASGLLLRFDPAQVPQVGTLPIVNIDMALQLTGAVPNQSIHLKIMPPCRQWSEGAATWGNAGCYPGDTSYTVDYYLDSALGWYSFTLPYHMRQSVSADGYYLLSDYTSPYQWSKYFASREAGPDYAPHLLISYPKDTADPEIEFSISSGSATGRIYKYPLTANVRSNDDLGTRRITAQISYDSGTSWEAPYLLADHYCNYSINTDFFGDPFQGNYRPGVPMRIRFMAEDCMGKTSEWFTSQELVFVRGCELLDVATLDGGLMPSGTTIQRLGDINLSSMVPGRLTPDFLGGRNTEVCFVSPDLVYLVKAPGFPTDPGAILVSELTPNPQGVKSMHVPWHGTLKLIEDTVRLQSDFSHQVEFTVPQGISTTLGFFVNREGEVDENPCCGQLELDILKEGQVLLSKEFDDLNSQYWVYRSIALPNLAGQTLVARWRLTHTQPGTAWAAQIKQAVVGSALPETWVASPLIAVSPQDAMSGINTNTFFGSTIVDAATTSTLRVTVPLSLTFQNPSIVPSTVISHGGGMEYAWSIPSIEAGVTTTLSYQIVSDAIGLFHLPWRLENELDPYPDNNQVDQTVFITPWHVRLPLLQR